MKTLTELSDRAEGVEAMKDSFKPEFAGPGGALKKAVGAWVPGVDTNSANWWKDYQQRAALVERHQLFGTALSAGEQKAWADATISPGMTADTIQHNLEKRSEIANKLYNKQLERQHNGSAGVYDVTQAFQPRGTGKVLDWNQP